MAIAIDFGTSNTAIARWNRATDRPELVELPELSQILPGNPPLVPSLVYVEDASTETIVAGVQVRDRGLDVRRDPRFFRSFKRGIGAEVPGFIPELDGVRVDFSQVGTWFLQRAIAGLQATVPESDSLVLTVPVDSFEAYRHWLTQACRSLAIEKVRLLDEPTAAALGYEAADKDVLLVVDFGGGTIDFSLVQLNLGSQSGQKPLGFILKWGEQWLGESRAQKVKTARVLAKAGANLGGTDLDNWLVDYFADLQGLPKSALTTRLAERLKVKLSTQTSAREAYFDDENLESYTLELDRDRFEEILRERQFFAQLDDLMARVLQQGRRNGIERSDIEAVLLVGGTGQIPAVRNWLEQYFSGDKIRGDRPFSAIAIGALQLERGVEVRDFLYHSYGVRYWDRREKRHSWHPIIKEGQPYPTREPIELILGASVENQPSIELIVGELGAETSRTEVYFEGDRLVARAAENAQIPIQPLNDRDGARTIATLDPSGQPGSDRIKVKFAVDEARSLRITVEDLLTQRTLLDNCAVAELS